MGINARVQVGKINNELLQPVRTSTSDPMPSVDYSRLPVFCPLVKLTDETSPVVPHEGRLVETYQFSLISDVLWVDNCVLASQDSPDLSGRFSFT